MQTENRVALKLPTPEQHQSRGPVKRTIDFSGVELRRVPLKPRLLWHVFRIEAAFPVSVGPSRRSDMQLAFPAALAPRD
jgi:hypothetical protein